MKLVTYSAFHDTTPRLGVVVDGDDQVVDLARCPGAPFRPDSMLSLIEAGPAALDWVRRTAESATDRLPLAQVRLHAPIPRPRRNVFCVGWNYVAHFEEGAASRASDVELPAHPTFFTKATNAVTGPYDHIPLGPTITGKLDWEAELAVVIGRRGVNLTEADAMAHVWGYAVLNDVTGRDLQRRHGNQWFKGKSLDHSCPMGPWIVTADDLDASALSIRCRVNGVVKQDASTRQMYFRIPRILAELSHGLTLEPGDIVATGTPQGVGHARTPPEFLVQGDVLETEIAGIGTLRNVIGEG